MPRKLCEHNKQKYQCRECNGSQICIHDKYKSTCRDCGGSAFCIHDKEKSRCRDCKGSGICIHDKRKSRCRDCGGNDLCIHDKLKQYCRDCKGNGFCIHDKQKSHCRECNGNAFCIHNKQKQHCKQCGGSSLCKSLLCETRAIKKYENYCMPCFVNNPENADKLPSRNYKTKESDVVNYIKKTYFDFDWVADKKVKDGCSSRRPDLLLDLGSHIVIVEIDENKHSNYDCSCENKRLMQLSQDLNHRPIVFVRFNPDAYTDVNKNRIPSCWKLNKLGVMSVSNKKQWNNRLETLKKEITYWIENSSDKMVEIVELFY